MSGSIGSREAEAATPKNWTGGPSVSQVGQCTSLRPLSSRPVESEKVASGERHRVVPRLSSWVPVVQQPALQQPGVQKSSLQQPEAAAATRGQLKALIANRLWAWVPLC